MRNEGAQGWPPSGAGTRLGPGGQENRFYRGAGQGDEPLHDRARMGQAEGYGPEVPALSPEGMEELADTPHVLLSELPKLTNLGPAFSFIQPREKMAWSALGTAPWPLKFRSAEFCAGAGCFREPPGARQVLRQASRELPRVSFSPVLTKATLSHVGIFPYVRPDLLEALRSAKQELLGQSAAYQVNSLICCNPYAPQAGRRGGSSLLSPSTAHYRLLELDQQYGALYPFRSIVNGLVAAAGTSSEALAQQMNRSSFVCCYFGTQRYLPALTFLGKRLFETVSQGGRAAFPIHFLTFRPDGSPRQEDVRRIRTVTVGNLPLSLEALPVLLDEVRRASFGLGCKTLVLEPPGEGGSEEDLSLDDRQFAGYPLEALVVSVCLAIAPRTVFTLPDGGPNPTPDERGRPSIKEPFSSCVIKCTGFWGVVHAQLFSLLAWCYGSVTVTKPIFSGLLNSERWIVCKNRRRYLQIPDEWETPEPAVGRGMPERRRIAAAGSSRMEVGRILAGLQYQALGNGSFAHLSRLVQVSGIVRAEAPLSGAPASARALPTRPSGPTEPKSSQAPARAGAVSGVSGGEFTAVTDPRDLRPGFLDYLYQVNSEIAEAQLRVLTLAVLHNAALVPGARLAGTWEKCTAALANGSSLPPTEGETAEAVETADTPVFGVYYPSNEKRKKMHFKYARWLCGGAYIADVEYILGGPSDTARNVHWRVELPARQTSLVKKVIVCKEPDPASPAGAGGGIGAGSGKGAGAASLMGDKGATDEVVVPGASGDPQGARRPNRPAQRPRPQKPKGGARNLGLAMKQFR